jgi:hypothetical protein
VEVLSGLARIACTDLTVTGGPGEHVMS